MLSVAVPISPHGVFCSQVTTGDRLVEVEIFPPNVSRSSFHIDLYEVTYKSVVDSFPLDVVQRVKYTNGSITRDALSGATAGVTYNVAVVSRSGHLASQPLQTTCTAGQFLPRSASIKRSHSCHAVSVCLSVCLSLTFVNSVRTNKHILKNFSPSGN